MQSVWIGEEVFTDHGEEFRRIGGGIGVDGRLVVMLQTREQVLVGLAQGRGPGLDGHLRV